MDLTTGLLIAGGVAVGAAAVIAANSSSSTSSDGNNDADKPVMQSKYKYCKYCKYIEYRDGEYVCSKNYSWKLGKDANEVRNNYNPLCGTYEFEHWGIEFGEGYLESENNDALKY